MPREILVHLNVQVPDGDDRPAEEIGQAIQGAIEVGSDNESVDGLTIEVALVDEI